MADVFVSYSRQDKARAAQFVQLLEGYGWDVFWDQETRAGTIWPKVLEDELGLARCLLVLWTANSVASRWVRIEAYEALQNDKLLPVRLENVKPPMEFRQTQTFDLLGWTGDPNDPRLDHLIADFCVLTKLGPRKGTIGPATLNVVRTLVPTTLGASTWPAPATLQVLDFSGHVVPTYRTAGLRHHAGADGTEREAAHETERSQTVESAIRVDTVNFREPATPTEGGYSATTAAPRQFVESAAGVGSRAADVASDVERIKPDPWRKRLSLGVGAAAIVLAIVWLGVDPETGEVSTGAFVAEFRHRAIPSRLAVADPVPHPRNESIHRRGADIGSGRRPQSLSPTRRRASRQSVRDRCVIGLPVVFFFQSLHRNHRTIPATGQITAAERQFLSSKECSR
jgi:hypothetical protein